MTADTYRRLGELLVERGIISERQLTVALAESRAVRGRLGDVLIARGFADERAIATCLAEQYRHPYIDLNSMTVDTEVAKMLRPADAVRLNALPFAKSDDGISVAIADPVDLPAADALMSLLHGRLELHIAPSDQLARRIRFTYGLSDESHATECPEAAMAPSRFENVVLRLRLGDALLFNAHDKELKRRVSLTCRPSISAISEACDEMTRAAANATSTTIWPIYEMTKAGPLTWTVMPPLPTNNLARVLKVLGPQRIEDAATWIANLAEEVDMLGLCGHPDSWACAENLFLKDQRLVLAPMMPTAERYWPAESPDGVGPDAAAYGLVVLLRDCLFGTESGAKPNLPMQMQEILETGLDPVRANRFGSPAELASDLRSFNWSMMAHGASTTMAERSELLKAIDGGLAEPSAKRGFFARLFGREAA
jgi:hypothetical protein